MQGNWFPNAVASAIAALAIAVGLFLFPWWSEGWPHQDLSSRFASRCRRSAGAWPLYIVIFGAVLSFGWTAILVWVVWVLIELTA
jgi:hypothetical protein